MTRLFECSEEELLEEIFKRYDDAVFSGRKILTQTGKTERRRVWQGDKDACSGLCEFVKKAIIEDIELR